MGSALGEMFDHGCGACLLSGRSRMLKQMMHRDFMNKADHDRRDQHHSTLLASYSPAWLVSPDNP